jgi:hypothetical protein
LTWRAVGETFKTDQASEFIDSLGAAAALGESKTNVVSHAEMGKK